MKRAIILLSLILNTSFLIAQSCLSGGITFTTQSQIDDFASNYPGCTEVLGNVTIVGAASINNLSGLSQLTTIGGNLQLFENSALTNLSGLEGLVSIGGIFQLYNNPGLEDLSNLNSLSSIDGDFEVSSNENLLTLTGLENLTSIGGYFSITNNNGLINFNGLNDLVSIGEYIFLNNNDALTNLNGLEKLTSIAGHITVSWNDALTSISGIQNINPTTIESIGSQEDLELYNNPLLSECAVQSICNFLQLPGITTDIHDNATGCNTVAEVETACPDCPSGYLEFYTQQEVDDFAVYYPNCTEIGGCKVRGGTSITNLNGLNNITSIGGTLNFYENYELVDLSGLDNLTSISGSLVIDYNLGLTDISNLSNLISVGGGLHVDFMPALTSLSGLENLTSLSFLILVHANGLSNLNPLNNLTSISGNMEIFSLDGLDNLSGLENLVSIGGNLELKNNYGDGFDNLNGLENLTSIGGNLILEDTDHHGFNLNSLNNLTSIGGSLELKNLDELHNLNGLDNIDQQSISNLIITSCAWLSVCSVQSICDYLDDPNNPATISNNASGCSSRPEVEIECLTLLPIELSDFSAKPIEDQVLLSWKTASEINNAGFEIQRSADARGWEALGFVEGKGTSEALNDYQFLDTHPFEGINYYRLKQIDFDGTFEFSDIVNITLSNSKDIHIYPNPTTGQVNITGLESGMIRLTDSYGRLLKEESFIAPSIDISSFPPGVYFLQFRTENHTTVKRIIKRSL